MALLVLSLLISSKPTPKGFAILIEADTRREAFCVRRIEQLCRADNVECLESLDHHFLTIVVGLNSGRTLKIITGVGRSTQVPMLIWTGNDLISERSPLYRRWDQQRITYDRNLGSFHDSLISNRGFARVAFGR